MVEPGGGLRRTPFFAVVALFALVLVVPGFGFAAAPGEEGSQEEGLPDVAVGCGHDASPGDGWVPDGPLAFDAETSIEDTGDVGFMLPEPTDVTCPGIRPGARISTPLGLCTLAFILTDGDRVYAATAGHCVNGPGDPVSIGGTSSGVVVASHYAGVGRDIAVILIDVAQEHRVDPRMCFWHGPEGTHSSSITGTPLLQTGHVLGYDGLVARPRAGVGGGANANTFYWNSPTAPGDSGSAVQTWTGGAVGIHTHTAIGVVGFKAGTLLGPGLGLVGMSHLELVTGGPVWVSPLADAGDGGDTAASGAADAPQHVHGAVLRLPQAT